MRETPKSRLLLASIVLVFVVERAGAETILIPCENYRQRCLRHVQRMGASSGTGSEGPLVSSFGATTPRAGPSSLTVEDCEKRMAQAKESGYWPVPAPAPPLACAR